MRKSSGTVLEISFKNLAHNFNYIKSTLKSTTKLLAVVKAFAYGNDSRKIAAYLEDLGADYFAVAYVSEGVALRKSGIKTPILVLHPNTGDFRRLYKYQLEPNIYSKHILESLIGFIKKHQVSSFSVHLEFDTGMKRLGFNEKEILYVLDKLRQNQQIKVASVFSHLVASEDVDLNTFSRQQIDRYVAIIGALKLPYPFLRHMLNTSGIFNYPEAHFDMVRTGIGLYGFGNDSKYSKCLIPIARLKTKILQINELKLGESVGYSRRFVAKREMRVATLPVGHADGIGRIYGGGNGFVYIKGQRAGVVGNVCMDTLMVDVTDIDCMPNDDVIIYDKNHSAEALTENAQTISYELLTALSPHIKKRYIRK